MNQHPSYFKKLKIRTPYSTLATTPISLLLFTEEFLQLIELSLILHLTCSPQPFPLKALMPLRLQQCSCQSHQWFSPSCPSLTSQQHLTQDTFPFLKYFILEVISCSPAFLPNILTGYSPLGLHSGVSSLLHFQTLVLPQGLLLKPLLSIYTIHPGNLI